MILKKTIPNFITILNLLSGCLAIIFIFDDKLQAASYLIFLAAVFDFLDGMAARVLDVKSELGRELDSLADIVSFGLVPGYMLMKLLQNSNVVTAANSNITPLIPYLALLIPIFSALRLAKFNTDTRQTYSFIGLATPASAILIASLPLIQNQDLILIGHVPDSVKILISNCFFLIALILLLSYLLIAEIPLFSLKLNRKEPLKNRIKYIFAGISLLLLVLFFFAAIPVILLLYVLISIAFKSLV